MKNLAFLALAALNFALCSTLSEAQIITWGAAQNMTGNPDVYANGTYFDAADAFGALSINNGTAGVGGTVVPFNGFSSSFTDGTITISGGAYALGAYGTAFTTASPSSASYSNLVNTGIFGNTSTATVTIGNGANPLTTGDMYQVESWTYYTGDGATTTYSGATSVSLLNSGQFALGNFVATGSSETFNFSSTNGHEFLNAISVRDISSPAGVPEPSTWAMLLGGVGALAFLGRRLRRA